MGCNNYGVRCCYFPIAENSFSRAQLLAMRNLVSTRFLAEAHYDIEILIEELIHLFEQEADQQAVSLLINWFRQLMVHGRIHERDYVALEEQYRSAQEVREMLIEALAKEKEQLRKEGRKEGERVGQKNGKIELVELLLQQRLGKLPDEIHQRLQQCTLAQLNELVNPALDVVSWDAFLAVLPAQQADE